MTQYIPVLNKCKKSKSYVSIPSRFPRAARITYSLLIEAHKEFLLKLSSFLRPDLEKVGIISKAGD